MRNSIFILILRKILPFSGITAQEIMKRKEVVLNKILRVCIALALIALGFMLVRAVKLLTEFL